MYQVAHSRRENKEGDARAAEVVKKIVQAVTELQVRLGRHFKDQVSGKSARPKCDVAWIESQQQQLPASPGHLALDETLDGLFGPI